MDRKSLLLDAINTYNSYVAIRKPNGWRRDMEFAEMMRAELQSGVIIDSNWLISNMHKVEPIVTAHLKYLNSRIKDDLIQSLDVSDMRSQTDELSKILSLVKQVEQY